MVFFIFYFCLFIYSRARERDHEQGWGRGWERGKESQATCMLSGEPRARLHRHNPETPKPKSGVTCLTDWASQVSLALFILMKVSPWIIVWVILILQYSDLNQLKIVWICLSGVWFLVFPTLSHFFFFFFESFLSEMSLL